MSCARDAVSPRVFSPGTHGATRYTHEIYRVRVTSRHPDTTPEGRMAMDESARPLPTDDELITRLETLVYHVRLAAKSGASTDLHMDDMRTVVLLRLLKLAIVLVCAIADKKKMGYQELKVLFAEMRIVGRKAR